VSSGLARDAQGQEFMDMMSKAWDMKAGEMKLKGGKMTTEQFDQWEKLLGTALRG
jgi:hypothetical protein